MITTTLRQIRQHNPCSEGWRTLLTFLGKTGADDDPLPLVTILQSNGLDDALWCLSTVEGHDNEITRFALSCAQEVKHLMTDQRSLDALDALERHLEIPLSREELDKVLAAARAAGVPVVAARAAAEAAQAAARTAARAAVEAAVRSAARAAEAAAWAAEAAAWAAAWAAAGAAWAAGAAGAEARARQSQIFEEVFG